MNSLLRALLHLSITGFSSSSSYSLQTLYERVHIPSKDSRSLSLTGTLTGMSMQSRCCHAIVQQIPSTMKEGLPITLTKNVIKLNEITWRWQLHLAGNTYVFIAVITARHICLPGLVFYWRCLKGRSWLIVGFAEKVLTIALTILTNLPNGDKDGLWSPLYCWCLWTLPHPWQPFGKWKSIALVVRARCDLHRPVSIAELRSQLLVQVASLTDWESAWLALITERVFHFYTDQLCSAASTAEVWMPMQYTCSLPFSLWCEQLDSLCIQDCPVSQNIDPRGHVCTVLMWTHTHHYPYL